MYRFMLSGGLVYRCTLFLGAVWRIDIRHVGGGTYVMTAWVPPIPCPAHPRTTWWRCTTSGPEVSIRPPSGQELPAPRGFPGGEAADVAQVPVDEGQRGGWHRQHPVYTFPLCHPRFHTSPAHSICLPLILCVPCLSYTFLPHLFYTFPANSIGSLLII